MRGMVIMVTGVRESCVLMEAAQVQEETERGPSSRHRQAWMGIHGVWFWRGTRPPDPEVNPTEGLADTPERGAAV